MLRGTRLLSAFIAPVMSQADAVLFAEDFGNGNHS